MSRERWEVRVGDNRRLLAELDAGSVQTCITSPPYWGLRDYGTATWEGGNPECDQATLGHRDAVYRDRCGKCGAKRTDSQLGLEPTPDEYVQNLVSVFREVRRVLRDDGTVWLNLGDSYNAYNGNAGPARGVDSPTGARSTQRPKLESGHGLRFKGLKSKDLVGIPWRVAFALRQDGWWLRSDIIWAKPNPMPESVTDRPTRSHEYLFLLTKSARYFYDADAIRENHLTADDSRNGDHYEASRERNVGGRNKRSVWTVATRPFPGAHFATFPPKLIEPCVLAGSSPQACGECGAPRWRQQGPSAGDWEPSCDHGDDSGASVVLDPFSGAGTTGLVALRNGRDYIGLELNPTYAAMSSRRLERYWTDDAKPVEPPPGQTALEL